MNINDILVSDCLSHILKNISLQELVRLRLVCSYWKTLIEKDIFPRKHSLKLFGSKSAIIDYCRNIVTFDDEDINYLRFDPIESHELIIDVKWFNEKFCRFISKLFPNIERLIIWFDRDSPFKDLPTLLEQYDSLKSLILLGNITYDPMKDFFLLRMCQAINRMSPTLKHLDLLSVNLFRTEPAIQTLINRMRDVIPCLAVFGLRLFGYQGDISPLINQLSSKCHKLRLESLRFFDSETLFNVFAGNPNICTNLSHLRLSGTERRFVQLVCNQFKSLHFLSLGFSGLPEIEAILLPELDDLTNLTELRIENVLLDMNLQLEFLPSLNRIKRLHLTGLDLGRWSFDDDRFLRILGTTFPSVEQLTLRCVNSIDEQEMIGSFEFSANYLPYLKPKSNVHLERKISDLYARQYRN